MDVGAAPALPQTCRPTAWLWPGQLIYAGPAFDLAPHSGSVWCVAVGIDRPLRVRVAATEIVAASVLIPPRTMYHLANAGERIVACYLDPASLRAESFRQAFTKWYGELGYHHCDEEHLIAESSALIGADGDDQRSAGLTWSHRALGARLMPALPRRPVGFPKIRPRRSHRVNWPPSRGCPNPDSCTCSVARSARVCGAIACGYA